MAGFIGVFNTPSETLSSTAIFVGTGAVFNLPVATLSSTLLSSGQIDAAFPLPLVELSSEMLVGGGLVSEFNLPLVTLSSALTSESRLSAVLSLPNIQLASELRPAGFISATFELPIIALSAAIRSNVSLSAAFVLPKVQLSAELRTILSANFRTWVLNTRKNALTEYNNFPFNSYAIFNGQVLACGASGVVVLATQALDNTTAITARTRTAKTDFELLQMGSWHKRVPRLYLDGSQDGDLLFRTIITESGTRTYRLPWNHISGQQQRRVPIGQGPRSRFWQFEIENEGGADFSIAAINAYPRKLGRRVA